MAATSIRTATKKRIYDVLSAAAGLSGVQVQYGVPNADTKRESVHVGNVRGRVEIAGIRAGRKTRKDVFTVDVWVFAGTPGQGTAQTAEERAEDLYGALEDVLAADPELKLAGVTLDGLEWAELDEVEGPDSTPTNEGWVAYVRAAVACSTRLT